LSPPRAVAANKPKAPAKKKQHDSDEDLSPPRAVAAVKAKAPDRKQKIASDDDLSPPRAVAAVKAKAPDRKRKKGSDDDLSPPRAVVTKPKVPAQKPPRQASDEDLSPPRAAAAQPKGQDRKRRVGSDEDISPPRAKEKKKLLVLGAETLNKPKPAQSEEAQGRGADTVYRDRGTGKHISREEWVEAQQKKKKKKLSEYPEQELEWGGGLKQTANRDEEKADLERIAAQPFARYAPDEKYMEELKDRQDWNDPMKNIEEADAVKKPVVPKPRCPHPAWNNRFDILPGYRWDGKIRGTGYETKWLDSKNHREYKKEIRYYYENLDE